jgi:hypothetical protein
MPPLQRNAPKLLSRVGGKRHASDEDHEERITKRMRSPAKRQPQKEEDIYGEPASSGDDEELRKPGPRTSRPSVPTIPTTTDELSLPQKKSASKRQDIEATSSGTARTRKAAKGKIKEDDDKENTSTVVPRSSAKSSQDDSIGFGMEHASQRSNKSSKAIKFGSKNKTANIHAVQQPAKKSLKIPTIRVPQSLKGTNTQASKSKSIPDDDGSESDVSMESIGEKDAELRKVEKKMPEARKMNNKGATLTHDELGAEFPNMPEDKDLKRATRRPKPTGLHDQIGDWMQDRAPDSSQPVSSAPQEDYGDLNDYLEQLPAEEKEGSICPLCRAPVKEDEYWEFWKGQKKTVKNQNNFCRSHRTASAWEEYRSEGYPDIDWDRLPQRLKKYRMELFKILNNDRPSVYRERYEPIALTGKAAAVPSKRKDLPEHVQQELESYALDDQSTYPGYYGPHGRRLVTETIMKVLKNEIKNSSDSVVQGSGPATFVQAVLVPEAAILLIMEDCGVDRVEAEEIREKTYEIGMLLNEEIEDRVETYEHSDDENEYGG